MANVAELWEHWPKAIAILTIKVTMISHCRFCSYIISQARPRDASKTYKIMHAEGRNGNTASAAHRPAINYNASLVHPYIDGVKRKDTCLGSRMWWTGHLTQLYQTLTHCTWTLVSIFKVARRLYIIQVRHCKAVSTYQTGAWQSQSVLAGIQQSCAAKTQIWLEEDILPFNWR